VVAIYSTFLQRGYDQLIHDVCIQNLPILFALDRAGLVGADGATHHGAFDLSFLRCLPNMVVMTPADENECRQMLYTGFQLDQPAAVRYPRGSGPGVALEAEMRALPLGKGEVRRRGREVAVLAFGTLLAPALEAGEVLDATVINMRFVKPIDATLIEEIAKTHSLLVTIEENVVAGGAGAAVAETLAARGVTTSLLHLGLPDRFIDHGDQAQLVAGAGLDKAGILAAVRSRLGG
jgi:1-deoxy-D-xylulose-5-phosphate synthase